MKYLLKNTKGKEINVTIDEFVKEDFKSIMGWNDEEFAIHTSPIIEPDKRTTGQILKNINELLGFIKYEDMIKWSNANKSEMLRLEKAIKELKDGEK